MLTTTDTLKVQQQTTQCHFAARLRHRCYSRPRPVVRLPIPSSSYQLFESGESCEPGIDRFWENGGLRGGWGLEQRAVAHLTIFPHTWLLYLLD